MSARLTIFEGPDGSGKSTAAQAFARAMGARYVHFSALPRVTKSLGRMYVEAMLPALLGYQDVVFDRSWLSEMPYGVAFREGQDRLSSASRRMLERLAMRCGVVVVRCQPEWKVVKANYLDRQHLEMLDNEHQLKTVYDLYEYQWTDLPETHYDYTKEELFSTHRMVDQVESMRFIRHPVNLASAGNWEGELVLVGESFAPHKDSDALYQWPFASFSKEGCSQWLADQLDLIKIGEDQILWINADQDLNFLKTAKATRIFALGSEAYDRLSSLRLPSEMVPHPQSWSRFNSRLRYPLLDAIESRCESQEILK